MNNSPSPRWKVRWLWTASICFALGLFDATQTVVSMWADGMHHAWVRLFLTLLLSWMPLALFTPLIMRLGRQHPIQARRPTTWSPHLAACILACLLATAFTAGLEELMNPWALRSGPGPFLPLWFQRFAGSIVSYVIFYASILAITNMLDSRQRLAAQETETARLNEQLSRARLDSLRRQIEPHFLFNTLNAIAGLVREQRNDDAVSMIARLSDFLRRVLQGSNRQEVPLREEMEFAQRYLDIQQIRFAGRLQLQIKIPEELLPAQVPSLFLQPIVENAVKHGVAKRAQGGEIRIAASRSNGLLCLSVYNDGPALATNWQVTEMGIGISNLQTRLQGLYGDRSELILRNQEPGGVEAFISLPYKET